MNISSIAIVIFLRTDASIGVIIILIVVAAAAAVFVIRRGKINVFGVVEVVHIVDVVVKVTEPNHSIKYRIELNRIKGKRYFLTATQLGSMMRMDTMGYNQTLQRAVRPQQAASQWRVWINQQRTTKKSKKARFKLGFNVR